MLRVNNRTHGLIALAVVLAAMAFPQAGAAQLPSSGLLGNVSSAFGGAGPYTGSIPGRPSIDIYCVDFFHYAPSTPVTYNFTRLTDAASNTSLLNATRWGPSNLEKYKKAAYLTRFFKPIIDDSGLSAAARNDSIAGLHSAIWHLFNPTQPNWTTAAQDASWFTIAEAGYEDYFAAQGGNWYIASDANTNSDPNARDQYGMANPESRRSTRQEYLVFVAPEPVSLILLATGLLAMVVWGRRRTRVPSV